MCEKADSIINMETDKKQLPYLIRLLEDESEVTRQELQKQFLVYGDRLKGELDCVANPLTDKQRAVLQDLMRPYSRDWLRRVWPTWCEDADHLAALEKAMAMLSEFQTGFILPWSLSSLLDELADEYQDSTSRVELTGLATFLFREKGLSGERTDYYNPLNSGLAHVIKAKRGIPISLACVYILVAHRLGLKVEGCNLPGHFLAKIELDNGHMALIDCFQEGKLIRVDESHREKLLPYFYSSTDVRTIVLRILGNLMVAYDKDGQKTELALIAELRNRTEQSAWIGSYRTSTGDPQEPLYSVGHIVRHRRYGYRGVIVERDPNCQASEGWYYANRTQPPKRQPWYHVFVDGGKSVTYAAQTSLMADDKGSEVDHPLVPYFFEKFEGGTYIRNHRPWPE